MRELQNFRRATENCWLWSPIGDAADTFFRRVSNGKRSDRTYESIWRLIHVWEASVITLASVLTTRLRILASDHSGLYLRAREYCHGHRFDEVEGAMSQRPAALAGRMDQWIDIVALASGQAGVDPLFVDPLQRFLDSPAIDLHELHVAWGTTCISSPDYDRTDATVLTAMRCVNAFRNRFAHVPFPPDQIPAVAAVLQQVTEQFFSVEPVPYTPGSVLTGSIVYEDTELRGTQLRRGVHSPSQEGVLFRFTNRAKENAQWPAAPFAFVDGMFRPYVLTRLKDSDLGTWEFTRFRAEANAVIREEDRVEWLDIFPRPRRSDYLATDGEEATDSSDPDRDLGLGWDTRKNNAHQALFAEEFERAIEEFSELVKRRPGYHVGWLRLGVSRRKLAQRMYRDNADAARQLLEAAITDLEFAGDHSESGYRARAHYERSKAFFHLHRLTHEECHHKSAHEMARKAIDVLDDPTYVSWLDYLDQRWPLAKEDDSPPAAELVSC